MKKAIARMRTHKTYDVETTCDLCGKTYQNGGGGCGADSVTIEARHGDVWPEGDFRRVQETDVCAECWPRARAALETIGCRFREFDSEYEPGDTERYDEVTEE